jgi:hypothetical protein
VQLRDERAVRLQVPLGAAVSAHDASHRRWEGRAATAEKTVWTVAIGDFQARCLRREKDYLVQMRGPKGWTEVLGCGPDPSSLLRRVVGSDFAATAISKRANVDTPAR